MKSLAKVIKKKRKVKQKSEPVKVKLLVINSIQLPFKNESFLLCLLYNYLFLNQVPIHFFMFTSYIRYKSN